MSSISAVGSQFTSPLQLLQNELSLQVSAGTIGTSDESALSTALESIDEAMQSQAQSDRASGTRPSPSDMQAKLESLIAAQVESGALTSSQAEELESVFANALPEPGQGGPGGPGGAGGPGGPGGAKPTDDDSDSDSTQSTDSDVQKLLEEFLKILQETLDKSSASYGSNGRSSSVSAALVVDFQS